MNKPLAWVVLALVVGAGICAADEKRVAPKPKDELATAAQNFAQAVQQASNFIANHPYYDSDQSRAAGMAHLARMMIRTLEEDVILDPDYPYFRVVDFRTREGGDNADQRYLVAPVTGGATYRIWGHRGNTRRLEFHLYAGLPWTGSGACAGTGGWGWVCELLPAVFALELVFELLVLLATAEGAAARVACTRISACCSC